MSKIFLLDNLIAHRGLHDEYVCENTMLSFLKAIEHNYIIELDVRLTRDRKIIVFHDSNFKRLGNVNRFVEQTNYNKIKTIKLNGKFAVPLFKDVLNMVSDKVPIIIDIKGNIKNYNLEEELLEILKNYNGRYAIQSFNPNSIKWLKRRLKCISGLIIFSYLNLKFIDKLFLNKKYDFIACYYKYAKNKNLQKIRNKKKIIGWTISNTLELKKYSGFCDNFICEKIL